jgi:DNA-binding NarL/FixJ family response regulator
MAENSTGNIRIHIVDDHEIFQSGLMKIIDLAGGMEVTGRSSNGLDAVQSIRRNRPDVVLMDVNLPDINGVQLTRQLSQEHSPSKFILITAHHDPTQTLYAMRSGAHGYCGKDISPVDLIKLIEAVMRGDYMVDGETFTPEQFGEWLEAQMSAMSRNARETSTGHFVPLSPRELEILTCLTMGMSNKEIAAHLNISQQTVKNHMTSIMTKLNVSDRTQAALTALRNGWVSR